jgi:hypothetical protein
MENKENPTDKTKEFLIKTINEEIEEEQEHAKGILETLKFAILSNLKVELVISNPPADVSSTVIVFPEKIENGCLWTTTDRGTKMATKLSRIKSVMWGI